MNKETRSFIWGLLLIFICGSGLIIHIIQLKSGMYYTCYDWFLFTACLYGTIGGCIRVFKMID